MLSCLQLAELVSESLYLYLNVSYGPHVLMLICAHMCVLAALDSALIIFEPLDSLVHKLIKMYLNVSKYETTRCEDGGWKRWPFGVAFA